MPSFKNLEQLKKFCGHLKLWRESGLFEFWRRFGSVAGRLGHAPSPKPCQNSKNSRFKRPQNFFNCSSVNRLQVENEIDLTGGLPGFAEALARHGVFFRGF
jgi:hypothetical protein